MSHEAARSALSRGHGVQALWTDCGVDLKGTQEPARLLAIARANCSEAFPPVWFAGFLFKGSVRTFERSSREEQQAMVQQRALELTKLGPRVVCCTSGAGTGSALEPERAALIRACVGPDRVVAVASGVTVENVHTLLPTVDIFMVATGIEQEPSDPAVRAFYAEAGIPAAKVGHLDQGKVRALADAIHAWTE
jgi:hypothetical protein